MDKEDFIGVQGMQMVKIYGSDIQKQEDRKCNFYVKTAR